MQDTNEKEIEDKEKSSLIKDLRNSKVFLRDALMQSFLHDMGYLFPSIVMELALLKRSILIKTHADLSVIIERLEEKISEGSKTFDSIKRLYRNEEIVLKKINAQDVISESINLLRHSRKTIHIKFINENKTDVFIKADSNQISHALINILINSVEAIKHTKNSNGVIIISLLHHPNEKTINIQIADNGRGISVSDIPKIHEPFFSTKESNSGLGLSIAKYIVEFNNGTLSVNSELGKGTKVSITLPVYSEELK